MDINIRNDIVSDRYVSLECNRIMVVSVTTLSDNWPRFFINYLNCLQSFFSAVYVVSSAPISECVIKSFGWVRFATEIEGDDCEHWKYALNLLPYREKTDGTTIFFSNDTFYGPIFNLDNLIDKMCCSEYELCGLTNQYHYLYDKKTQFVHTYFFSIKQSVIPYFIELSFDYPIQNKDEYISEYFTSKGIKVGVIYNIADELNGEGVPEPSILTRPQLLIDKYNIPFLPRYIFAMPTDELQLFSDGFERFELLAYLKKHTNYPTEYIIEDGLNQLNVYDFVNRFGMTFVPSAYECKKITSKCAAIIYLFYENQINDYSKWLKRIPSYFDIFILSQSKDIIESIRKTFTFEGTVEYIESPIKGREWSALFTCMKNRIFQYDIVCFLHDKLFHDFEFPSQGISFRNMLWENLLPSKDGVISIINYMEDNPYIGLMVPPVVKMGTYFKYFGNFWTKNFDNTANLLSRLEVPVDCIRKDKPPISLGGMFWLRPISIKELFDEVNNVDYPDEPLELDGTINHAYERVLPFLAQKNGYATSFVVKKEYLIHDWLVVNEMVQSLNGFSEFSKNTLFDQLKSLNN